MKKVRLVLFVVFWAYRLSFGGVRQAERLFGSKPPALIPRAVLFGNPEREHPRISPDGARLAFLAPSPEGIMNVWIRPLDGGEAVQLTAEKKRGIRSFFWAPGGGEILYLQDADGDENFHVFLTGVESKITRDLTPFRETRAVNLICRSADILVGLNLRNRALFDMYAVDLKTGAVRLDTENPGDVVFLTGSEWLTDGAGVLRAVRAMDFSDGSTVLKTRGSAGESWREIARWPGGGIFEGEMIGFSADGQSLFVTSGSSADTAGIVRLDARTGRELESLIRDDRCDVWTPDIFFDPAPGRIRAAASNYLKKEWNVLDPGIAGDFRILEKFRPGFFRVVSRDRGDSKWVVSYEISDGPVSSYVYDRKSGAMRFLFDDKPALSKVILAPVRAEMIEARDGLKLVSYLTLPVGRKPENLPLVLFVHGGPTARDEWIYDPIVQLLANRGYAVLQVNFRGSVGFGTAFQRAGDGQIGVGAMQNDLTDAVGWAVRNGIADPRRIGIMGYSYGGYAALAGLAFTPGLYACGVSGCGPADIKTLLESVPSYMGPIKNLFCRILGDAENDEAYNRKVSPIFHVDQIRAPLLIGQGANDPRCPIDQSSRMAAALRARNLPVTYIVYPDEGHGFRRPENNMDFYGRLEEFLARFLGGDRELRRDVPGSTAELR